MTETGPPAIRDARGLGRLVVAAIYVNLALVLVNAILSLLHFRALMRPVSGGQADDGGLLGLGSIDAMIPIAGGLWTASTVAALVVSLWWIHRASRNAHVLASGLTVGPAWAAAWFFVPIAALWMPFRGMRETWQASVRPEDWGSVPVPGRMRWWWASWLAVGFLTFVSIARSYGAATVGDAVVIDVIDMVTALIWIPLSLLFTGIVGRLNREQAERITDRAFD